MHVGNPVETRLLFHCESRSAVSEEHGVDLFGQLVGNSTDTVFLTMDLRVKQLWGSVLKETIYLLVVLSISVTTQPKPPEIGLFMVIDIV